MGGIEDNKKLYNTWWGYLHVDGSVQVKRFFDQRDIDEAVHSAFVARVTGRFEAKNRQDAEEKAVKMMGLEHLGKI